MRTIITILTSAFLSLNILYAQNASKYSADMAESFVTYHMKHPLKEWDGTSKNVKSVLIYNNDTKMIDKVAVAIPVSTFDSQNANRDSHMIEVVEGIKFPAITFSSSSITGSIDKMTVNGVIEFHGIKKNISFEATGKVSEKGIEVIGEFNVKMSEFNIENPTLMGMPTNDVIQLKFYSLYKVKP